MGANVLRSMTGYGRGEASGDDVTVVVELKSVNNRFRDLQLRCPREYAALEPRVTAVLKEAVQRGRVEVAVRRVAVSGAVQVVANPALAKEYARGLATLGVAIGATPDADRVLAFIAGQPGVLQVVDADVDVLVEWDVVETALRAAVADLLAMREREGAALSIELQDLVDEVRALVAQIDASSVGIADRLQERLHQRLQRLVADRVDAQRLAQETALLADKADVTEEIVRMQSHCDQFSEALRAGEPVGRRLDFLLQEMNRESNTIGSKAAEHPTSHRVVELKTVLERMREQSANIE